MMHNNESPRRTVSAMTDWIMSKSQNKLTIYHDNIAIVELRCHSHRAKAFSAGPVSNSTIKLIRSPLSFRAELIGTHLRKPHTLPRFFPLCGYGLL